MWNFEEYKNNIAVIDAAGAELSYEDLTTLGDEIASYVEGRSLVAVLCTNTAGSILGYSAFINHRIVPMMINAGLERQLLIELLEKYTPAYIWLPDMLVDEYTALGKSCMSSCGYTLLKSCYSDGCSLYSELALLLTTSGSTGSPKFVRQSYENIRSNTEAIVKYLELDASEKPITTLPMNYTYGLSIINTHLMVGATILATEMSLMQKEFWQFFKSNQATSFGGVPYTYEILKKLRFFRMELPSLKTMTQAGGKLTPELHEEFARFAKEQGKKFIVMYGQCEATARMGYLPADFALDKCGSMGIAIPGGKFTIIDLDGNAITEPHIPGELVYEGKNVTLGYADSSADLIKGDERKGTLRTGDVAEVDEDGFYYIVGRLKRFLKIYGNRVNLDEVDALIKGKFDGIECACAGVDDHMFIFLTDESIMDAVRVFISETTKLNQKAFSTVVIPKIPQNDAGKTLYKELEKYYRL